MTTPQILEQDADSRDDIPLYAPHKKVFPQSVQGRFRTIKWTILIVCLSIYYFLPFVRWHRGLHAPDQAVLIDFPNRRFYFFWLEIWPQEFYYITGLLVLAALILFLMNAVAGRLWCGYLCPQTVWTDLFYAIERWVEGDRRERIRKEDEPLTLKRIQEIVTKHFLWLMVAWWTGGAWVLYFADAPTLVKELATGEASMVAYVWIGILTFTTYSLAGFMRDQVCNYMCPWPRIQAALTDEYALNVTYRYDRGEPRGSLKKNEALARAGEQVGDCIDCGQCVAVCPTGVDIRDGAQLGCIQCGLCIDACDNVMSKVKKPLGLIAYDNDMNIGRREQGLEPVFKMVRPRTIIYVILILIVSGLMLLHILNRSVMGLSVVHDRNPVFVNLADGGTRNAYALNITNKLAEEQQFVLDIGGLKSPELEVVGIPVIGQEKPVITVPADQVRAVRVLVTQKKSQITAPVMRVVFRIMNVNTGEWVIVKDNFRSAEK